MANTVWDDIKKRVASTYGETIPKIPESGRAILNGYRGLPIFQKTLIATFAGGVLFYALAPAMMMGSASAIAIQMVGLGALAIGQLGAYNKEHRHMLPLMSVSTTIGTAQCLYQGDVSGAAMIGHAALFTTLASCIPEKENYNKFRNGTTWIMGAAGAGLAALFLGSAENKSVQEAPWFIRNAINAIPVLTVIVNAYAFTRPDETTQRARLCYLFCNLAHFGYFATREVPLANVMLAESALLATNLAAVRNFDLVKTDSEGHPLSLSRRLSIYFKNSIWGGEDRSAHGLTPNDLAKKASTPEAPQIS